MDRRLDFIIINETAYLLVLQHYMQQFSFYQFQIYKIQIGYICNELELNNPSLNHKNHFAKVQYLNFLHSHLEFRILTRNSGTRPDPTRNFGSGQTNYP